MRFLTLIPAAVALLLCSSVHAQQWIEYENRVMGFNINFPHEPTMEQIDYTTWHDDTVPAYVFSAERETGRYSVTVVDFSDVPTDSHTAISHAAEAIGDKGEVTYSGFESFDGVPGQRLSVTQPDGRLIQAGFFFHDQRLYIAEGSVAAGNPVPNQFNQTLFVIDSEGNGIIWCESYNDCGPGGPGD